MINQQEDKDYQLLRDSLGGNALAQKDFFVRFSKTVYAVCLRYMNNEDDAKDMLQECLIKVFQKGGEFRFEGSLEGWIRRISVNTCLDHIKKRRLTFTDDIANLGKSVRFLIAEMILLPEPMVLEAAVDA